MYTPILRNRQSEMLAFRGLASDVREQMMPLVDIAAPTKSADQAAAEKYVANNIARTEKAINGIAWAFVDSSELPPDFRLPGGVHPLVAAATAVTKGGTRPIAVTGLHRDQAHHEASKTVMRAGEPRLCVRLDATDVSTATMSLRNIKALLAEFGLTTDRALLLLDLQGLYGLNVHGVAAPVIRLLGLLHTDQWAGVIVGGYGVPEQLSTAVPPNSQDYLPRIEQEVYSQVRAYAEGSTIWFADYTMLPPSVIELDWRLIGRVITPKALYALDNAWLVVRGGAFASHPKGYDQYHDIAGEVVALDEFSGSDFSPGDQYIADRVDSTTKPGSPATWITACVSHHLSLTARAHAAARSS